MEWRESDDWILTRWRKKKRRRKKTRRMKSGNCGEKGSCRSGYEGELGKRRCEDVKEKRRGAEDWETRREVGEMPRREPMSSRLHGGLEE